MKSLFAGLTIVAAMAIAASPAQAQSGTGQASTVQTQGDTDIVSVRTLPPIGGIEIGLDDQVALTDEDGVAYFFVDSARNLRDRITVSRDEFGVRLDNGRARAQFARLYRIDARDYVVFLDITMPVSFTFTDTNDSRIDRTQIQTMTLKNRLGGILEDIPLDRPVWLFASRVVSTQRGPEVRDIEWAVEDVSVRDTNVVNRAQVRFFPANDRLIDVPVLFFSASFRVSDMFFGFAQGDKLSITYPDGEIIEHDLDDDGVLVLESVPRGEYHVVVVGSGPDISRPVALSRNQEVDLDFLSWLDIGLVLVAGLFFLSIPVVLGRRLSRRRRDEAAPAEAGTAPATPARVDDDQPADRQPVGLASATRSPSVSRWRHDRTPWPSGSPRNPAAGAPEHRARTEGRWSRS